ncbi:hypothetical protein [Afipia felis]|uniref:Uncharacterized protein n=2 Tax=Afipia felis TaxID=1035 RepID=A0A380WAS4_AFIFE|nr:hypothetical protein [Afipia felis]EKS29311.1 hypothetical protein HMPREF9697_01839 [Afipia felis ATCC 53690]SUU78019.1 Uncharacterised protein [Afipia felis]SUU86084.1 Uncharacterised protein [Afipia felis]
MKLVATVHEVKKSGERLCVSMKAKQLQFESLYSTVLHEIEIPDTETARRTYYIGRRVSLEVKPA